MSENTETATLVLSLDEDGEEATLTRDFYRCPNTGEWVYRWAHERLTLAVPTEHENGSSGGAS